VIPIGYAVDQSTLGSVERVCPLCRWQATFDDLQLPSPHARTTPSRSKPENHKTVLFAVAKYPHPSKSNRETESRLVELDTVRQLVFTLRVR